MTTLLDISGDEIALLNDADLRELIGRLCEADYKVAGFSPKGINWGGHQDASDGGLDVTVHGEFNPPDNSFVPRKITGFQVKKPDMHRSEILEEMRPKGILREEIRRLLCEHGAYVIVSSSGSTTETALKNRVNAMREAVKNEPGNDQLYLDFFDRGHVATWVRSHPSLVLWVRNKINRPLLGWQSYGNWANTPNGLQDEYLLDDELRLIDGVKFGEGLSVLEGIIRLRQCLSNDNVSIRLIGLSGVGKTRLIQALFDEQIGEYALNPYLAYYTDMSANPIPDPISFAYQLIYGQINAILIIDNCSPELHRQLTTICSKSNVKLLTVEYDIQDDLPEETGVFRLEPASDNLIEKLLEKRYAHISQIDASTIAEFASGNARVAIALANTLKQGESLSTLRDLELFKRLFHQKHPNENLIISAEICSLVYSFDGLDISDGSELEFLANLARKSVNELYRDVQELMNRGLIQSRSVWRALLPHAISNRLAKQALDSNHKTYIVDAFLTSGSERLIKSFTRRLGYLHDSPIAVEIANDWLRPDGLIGKTNCNFNSLGLSIFKNIAPIIPESALLMLERATSNNSDGAFVIGNDQYRHEFIGLLQNFAYESELFERSTKLLCRYALLESPDINDGSSARSTLKSLFHILLSGTQAPPKLRAKIISELVNSDNQDEANLGIKLLDAAMQTSNIYATNIASFGARSRNFGYQPKSAQDVCNWYEEFIKICINATVSDNSIADEAKLVLANNLRGLWAVGTNNAPNLLGTLEDSAIRIHDKRAWNEGWIAVKGIMRFDSKRMPQTSLERIKQLEKLLRPANLLERARTYAVIGRRLDFLLEDDCDEFDDIPSNWERVQQITRRIGAEIVRDINVFKIILPELIKSDNERLWSFGAGLVDGCKDRQKVWQMLYDQLVETPPEQRRLNVFLGFLSACAKQDPAFYNTTLDNLIEDKLLGQWFPIFQLTSPIDANGIKRLHKSLDSIKVKVCIDSFQDLAWGRRHEPIDDDSLATLVQKICVKEGGPFVATEILSMRFHGSTDEPRNYSPSLISVGQDVMANFPFDTERRRNGHLDFALTQVADVCLRGKDSVDVARKICQTIAEGFQKHQFYTFDYPYLLNCLARIHPYTFLDLFVGAEYEISFLGVRFEDLERKNDPLYQIPQSVLIDWCEIDPNIRYLQLVQLLRPYYKTNETEKLSWKPIIFSILEKAPNIQEVLSRLQVTIRPMSWSGSYAETLEKRLVLLSSLYDHPNQKVRDWAKEHHQKLQSNIKKQREIELNENKNRFERFE